MDTTILMPLLILFITSLLLYRIIFFITRGLLLPILAKRSEIEAARASQSGQHYRKALHDYQQALLYNPNNVTAYIGRGDILLRLRRYEEALADYNAVIELDPMNAQAFYAKAVVLRNLGQDEDALSVYEEARKLELKDDQVMLFTSYAEEIEVERFLIKAGFDIKHFPNKQSFLALAGTTDWKQQFPKGLYMHIALDKPLDQSLVRSIYEVARDHQTDHALVIINQQLEASGWGEISILRGEQGQGHFVCLPIDIAVIQEAVASNNEQLMFQNYLMEHLGKGFDPYNVHDPVSDAISFFGRQRLTEDLLNALRRGQKIGLFGIQKMGKSSVLLQLQKRADFPVAYVYLGTDDELSRIYERIVDDWITNSRLKYPNFQWTRPIAGETILSMSDFDMVAKSLLSHLNTLVEKPLLGIFLDEIEHIVPSEGNQRQLSLYIGLMDTLRGLQQETNGIALLVAGVHPGVARKNYFWGTQKNPMYQIITEQFLPPLSKEDCSNMLVSLGKQVDLEYEDAALERILELSGCHPYLARRICSLAYKENSNTTLSVEMIENIAWQFIRNPETASYFNETGLWRELGSPDLWEDEVGRANWQLLCRLAYADQDLSEDELCTGLDKKASLAAFYVLKERSIIVAANNSRNYHIAFGIFRDWIRFSQLEIE